MKAITYCISNVIRYYIFIVMRYRVKHKYIYIYILDTCRRQTMLPQAMAVCEVSWYLTWVLSSAETHGACV